MKDFKCTYSKEIIIDTLNEIHTILSLLTTLIIITDPVVFIIILIKNGC